MALKVRPWLIILAGILLLPVLAGIFGGLSSVSTPASPAAPIATGPLASAVTVHLDSWTMSGSIMLADFTITNRNPKPVKDVEVRCDHAAKSGTVIDHNTRTIYEVFEPAKPRTIKRFNMGFIHSQAESSSCHATKIATP